MWSIWFWSVRPSFLFKYGIWNLTNLTLAEKQNSQLSGLIGRNQICHYLLKRLGNSYGQLPWRFKLQHLECFHSPEHGHRYHTMWCVVRRLNLSNQPYQPYLPNFPYRARTPQLYEPQCGNRGPTTGEAACVSFYLHLQNSPNRPIFATQYTDNVLGNGSNYQDAFFEIKYVRAYVDSTVKASSGVETVARCSVMTFVLGVAAIVLALFWHPQLTDN